MTELAHALTAIAAATTRAIEFLGVIVIAGAIVAALVAAAGRVWRREDHDGSYRTLRRQLGRGILLGLELLVAADIIATVTEPITLESAAVLAIVVLIRTVLSLALETEMNGRFPWKRAAAEEAKPEREGAGRA